MTNSSLSDPNAEKLSDIASNDRLAGQKEPSEQPDHALPSPAKSDAHEMQPPADAHTILGALLSGQPSTRQVMSQPTSSPEPSQSTTIPLEPRPSSEQIPPPTLSRMQSIYERWQPYIFTALRWLLVVLAFYLIFWILRQAGSALTPFIIGLVLAYLMLPIVNRLNRSAPRWLAILLVYILFTIVIGIFIAYIGPILGDQTSQLISKIPTTDELQKMGGDLLQYYRSTLPENIRVQVEAGLDSALNTFKANLTSYARSVGEFALNQVLQIASTLAFIVGLLIIPIWLFFVLNDAEEGHQSFNRMVHPRAREDFWNVWGIIDHVLSNYVRGQLILGLAVGIAVAFGLLILRMLGFNIPYIVLLSIIAAVTELIPIIGPVIGAVPAILLGFTVSPAAGIAAILLYVIIQQLENNFLVPRIVGESVGIHPAILTVALIVMGQAFGLIGVILSAPLAAISRDLFVYTYRRLSGLQPQAARANLRT